MGLEAANNVISYCGVGARAPIIPLEAEESHILAARGALRATQWAAGLNPLARLLPPALA